METLFGINDIVICVDSSDTRLLVEGKKYKVEGVMPCNCGRTFVDIGIMILDSIAQCCPCGAQHPSHKKAWYKETRFVKAETDKAIDNEIREALNEDIKVRI